MRKENLIVDVLETQLIDIEEIANDIEETTQIRDQLFGIVKMQAPDLSNDKISVMLESIFELIEYKNIDTSAIYFNE